MRELTLLPWKPSREKTVAEKGMEKPRTPRSVGFAEEHISSHEDNNDASATYLIVWIDPLLLLKAERTVSHIDRSSVVRSLGESGHCYG